MHGVDVWHMTHRSHSLFGFCFLQDARKTRHLHAYWQGFDKWEEWQFVCLHKRQQDQRMTSRIVLGTDSRPKLRCLLEVLIQFNYRQEDRRHVRKATNVQTWRFPMKISEVPKRHCKFQKYRRDIRPKRLFLEDETGSKAWTHPTKKESVDR